MIWFLFEFMLCTWSCFCFLGKKVCMQAAYIRCKRHYESEQKNLCTAIYFAKYDLNLRHQSKDPYLEVDAIKLSWKDGIIIHLLSMDSNAYALITGNKSCSQDLVEIFPPELWNLWK